MTRSLGIAIACAFSLAGCSTEPPSPFAGAWTGRVLLLPSVGVPLLDSSAQATVLLSLSVSGNTVTGTATGLFGAVAPLNGTVMSTNLHFVIAVGGAAGSQAIFDGQLVNDSIPGAMKLNADPASHAMRFNRT